MKRLLLIIAVVLTFVGCSKSDAGVIGVWCSSTNDGKLFLELRSGGNGVAYFEECSSSSAFWSLEDNVLKVTGHAYSKDFVYYNFGDGRVVSNDVIRVGVTISQAHRSDKTKELTFTKQ